MIINCTTQDIAIYNIFDCKKFHEHLFLNKDNGYPEPLHVYSAADKPVRVKFVVRKTNDTVDGYPVDEEYVNPEVIDLPKPKSGTYYIVPKMVAQVLPERKDLIFPGTIVYGTPTGSKWINPDNYVLGCIGFSRIKG